jgi:hypothetical protein
MRGRLYPQPRQRYERFRLNPYSPLYHGLAFFTSASLVPNIARELHGPYALPGTSCFPFQTYGYITQRFFAEIGRAASSPAVGWSIRLSPQQVITLTVMAITSGSPSGKLFAALYGGVNLTEGGSNVPGYSWANVDGTSGSGSSAGRGWPLNKWFTYSATFRPGSVSGYLSNWGVIDVTLNSGVWPSTIAATQTLWLSGGTETFVADAFVHLRELSLTELQAISDYGNVDLRVPDGAPLILPVRTYWPSVLPVAPSYLKRRSLGARSGTREAAL